RHRPGHRPDRLPHDDALALNARWVSKDLSPGRGVLFRVAGPAAFGSLPLLAEAGAPPAARVPPRCSLRERACGRSSWLATPELFTELSTGWGELHGCYSQGGITLSTTCDQE